ncbi:hypothetical protein SPRG_02802 [Saprolegnia parasitica CBS 223.65]|uniref:Uncharacterized protein n=1 Tax=Saprolegnia parasitica (strain CBS 223.65) TaxID=695850 RepID=A0A067CPA6_SAPPC|nr:hypothetical protein SPRG_02802 [Saprolegnia parasitica CBS 223.65]KDO32323.1 hypothetical protein SPRG_02802 [Saprolegnia parasitica CBS 223.65]|eukprot:XP_012196779.1 hypothetical protein SPRG_02802 [Saprolegnia parasitica CBS 223.65]
MASFADILSQPSIAALVLSYQCGIYGDVYPRFAASRRAVECRCGYAERGMYVIVTSLVADDSVDTDDEHLSVLYATTLGLTLASDSDARFPLHVSIAEGDAYIVDRAIETAFLHHRVAIAKDFLVRRDPSLPALYVRQSPLDADHWTQRNGLRTVLYHDSAEAFAWFLQYASLPSTSE